MSVITLLYGDCKEKIRNMSNNEFDLILTDPPYNLSRPEIEYYHKEFTRIARCVIVFTPPENQWINPANQYLFWIKTITTRNVSKSYGRFVRMIFVYGRNEWNVSRHWSQFTNVFHDLVDGKLHPHQKPESLIKRLLLNHTKEKNKILDPFMGSGTTGLVCKNTDRKFVGIEIDPHYYEIAKKRIGI